MNTAARTLKQSIVTPRRLIRTVVSKTQAKLYVLLLAVVISALSVIYVTNNTRQLYSQLQQMQTAEQTLNTQWGQLLLEQGSWQSQTHVADIASQHLGMVMPKHKHIILVK